MAVSGEIDARRIARRRVAQQIGDAVVALDDLRGRLVMTTFDPDTVSQDPEVLRDIVRRFEGTLCLNASVITPARVAIGDPVHLR